MAKENLPSANVIGRPYNLSGEFANESATSTTVRLFRSDFLSDTEGRAQVYGTEYKVSKNLIYTAIGEGSSVTSSSTSFESETSKLECTAELEGEYVGFEASVEASYSTSCTASAKMWNLCETNHVRAYKLSLGTFETLRANLDPTFETDLNGDMSAKDLVAKYGTHFLYSGVFGGQLIYSQSFSAYEYTTEDEASVKVSANYASVKASFSAETSSSAASSSTQSEGSVLCRGGVTSDLDEGFDVWCENMEKTHSWVLCDFDPDSLQPISVLTADAGRAREIDAQIKKIYKAAAARSSLRWSGTPVRRVIKGEDKVELGVDVATNRVITGVAIDVRDKAVHKMALRYLELVTNETGWTVSGGAAYNATDYEKVLDLSDSKHGAPRGVAAVGFGFAVNDNKVSGLRLYYQELNPVDGASKPTWLVSASPLRFATEPTDKSKLDYEYIPSGGKVLTYIGLNCGEDTLYHMVVKDVSLNNAAS